MIRLLFKYNPNHVASGPNGGQFTSKPKPSAKAPAKAPAKAAASPRDPVSEKLFNGKKILLDGTFDLRSPQRREIIDNHPDFKGLNEVQVQQKVVSQLFGKPTMTSKDYARLVGAPDGSTVSVYVTMYRHSENRNNIVYEASIETEHKSLYSKRVITSFEWETDPKKFDTPQRGLEQAGFDTKTFPKGKRVSILYNETFISHAGPGAGIGVRSFSTMAKHAEEYNISAAYTFAAGSKAASSAYNGYYTWPRLGYEHIPRADRSLQKIMQERYNISLLSGGSAQKPSATTATSISELMKTEQGRKDWQNFGNSVWSYFDMRKGSPQKALLGAYLKEKGIAV